MKYKPVFRKKFQKDIEKMRKRGKNLEKLKLIISLLLEGKPLPEKCRDHWLVGNFVNHKDCHIEPDWLLIYYPTQDSIIFERTGTHSDLFKS